MYGWNQYRDSAGNPLYPQRPVLIGEPFISPSAGGAIQNGNFHGKMIMLGSALDIQAFPWGADWYHQKAISALGNNYVNNNYRIWYMDNAPHGNPEPTFDPTHEVNYQAEVQQALLYIDSWVDKRVEPPASTNYRIDSNTQLQLPATAYARRGVQPVVQLSVVGRHGRSDVTTVKVGQRVTFLADAQLPPGTGKIVSANWDFEGTGTFPIAARIQHSRPTQHLTGSYAFTHPGTYFAIVRFTSERDGQPIAPYGLVQNIDRVRVIVH